MAYVSGLKQKYGEHVIAALKEESGYRNVMQVPKLEKVIVSCGVGSTIIDKKQIDYATDELARITGQKAIATYSKKDVVLFKLRKGMAIDAKVTLCGERMHELLDRLITTALPRVRGLQGIKTAGFDGRGSYNLGIIKQIIFPEVDIDKISKIAGMDITFVIPAHIDKEAKPLLSELGLPFKEN